MTNQASVLGGARQIELVPLDLIDVGDRLRTVSADHVRMLMESIREIGQTTPIEIRPEGDHFKLVAGGHRYAAVRELGQTEIEAIVSDLDDLQARLREIDENLYRHELNPLDRGRFLAERKAIWEALYPETRKGVAGGKARQNSATDIVSFAETTALSAGYSARSIRRTIAMYERLAPAVRERLAGTEIARDQSQLIALSKLAPSEQTRVVRMLLAPDVDRPRKVKDAVAILAGKKAAPVSKADKGFQRLMDTWGRAGKRDRKQFLAALFERGDLNDFIDELRAYGRPEGDR